MTSDRLPGISTGASTAFFGLSPLFLSLEASAFFSSKDGELDVTHFIVVLSITAGIAHLAAAVFLRVFPPRASITAQPDDEIDNPIPVIHPTEHTPLLNKQVDPASQSGQQTVWQLLSDADFWLLAGSMLLLLGSVSIFSKDIYQTANHFSV
jgi:hypothetical protein